MALKMYIKNNIKLEECLYEEKHFKNNCKLNDS